MAVTRQGGGTQVASIGTEHTLLDVAVAGTFTFHVDANAMAAADTTELRIYQILNTGGTRRVCYYQSYTGAQTDETTKGGPIKVSVPISNDLTDAGSLRFTIKQTAGTGRSYDWKVLLYA